MNLDLFFWLVARISGIGAFGALAITVLTGIGLRTAVLDWLATNRALRAVHEFATITWMPLGALHLVALVFDETARVGWLDLVIPFNVDYAPVAIGIGTIAFDIFILVTVTSWIRSHMNQTLWRWLHRTAYAAFALSFVHAFYAGSDFSSPVVSALAWSIAAVLLVLGAARMIWGRLPA